MWKAKTKLLLQTLNFGVSAVHAAVDGRHRILSNKNRRGDAPRLFFLSGLIPKNKAIWYSGTQSLAVSAAGSVAADFEISHDGDMVAVFFPTMIISNPAFRMLADDFGANHPGSTMGA